MTEINGQRIHIAIDDIGLSIVNDIKKQELLYISFNKSKVIWTETKKARVKPLEDDINKQLEDLYQKHSEEHEARPDDKELLKRRYKTDHYKV